MALVKVGNSHVGSSYRTTYIFDEEDDDGNEYEVRVEMEYVLDSGEFVGYKLRLPTATYEGRMRAHVYHRRPTSDDYDEYIGLDTALVFPLVYRCDSGGNLRDFMIADVPVLMKDVNFTGWIDCEFTLKQNLNAGDLVFFGFYTGTLNPVWDANPVGVNGTPFGIHYIGPTYYGDKLAAVIDGSVLQRWVFDIDGDWYSLYFEYYDSPLRTDYLRSVASGGLVTSLLSRKSNLRRTGKDTSSLTADATKKLSACRIHFEDKNIEDVSARNLDAARGFLEDEVVRGASVRHLDSVRDIDESGEVESSVVRSVGFFQKIFEGISFFDFVVRFFGFVCKVFSVGGGTDGLERSANYRRGEISENNSFANVVAGRLIFRAVATVFGLWDWLLGKVRNENCVVELFTPICDELILECKI